MRIGVFISEGGPGGTSIDGVVERARWAEANGLDAAWVPHVPWSHDALTVLAIAGRETSRIGLGTAVVPTWSRHPYAMAQQALTTDAACGGRLRLGIGPSHPNVAEQWYGASYEGVIHHVREYVGVLEASFAAQEEMATSGQPAGQVRHDGERYPVQALLGVPDATRPALYLAALAPLMLRLAGERAAGTITWMCDERTHAEHIVPRLEAAATEAGRPAPRVVAGLPLVVADDPAEAYAVAARRFAGYGDIPTYGRMLDKGDASSPADVALTGTESQIAERIAAYEAAGVTDLAAMVVGAGAGSDARMASRRRAEALLASLAG